MKKIPFTRLLLPNHRMRSLRIKKFAKNNTHKFWMLQQVVFILKLNENMKVIHQVKCNKD
jgi:hypothetical protein